MNEAIIAIGLGLLLVGVLFLIIWDTIHRDDDDNDTKPPYGGGGGGDTSHAVRTATIGGGIGGA